MRGFYICVNKTPQAVPFSEWTGSKFNHVRVALDEISGVRVSTIFLGIDQRFGDGPPILFETMIFCPSNEAIDQWRERCCTWEEAETLHKEACKLVRESIKEDG